MLNVASRIVSEIHEVVSAWNGPVVVAYSGGKDSSAVLKLLVGAWKRFPKFRRDIKILYCDTGVENPLVENFVKKTLFSLSRELLRLDVCDPIRILRPKIGQRYFARIIGRGYPPPTQFFRWCTKDLRIRPVQQYLRSLGGDPLVLVGTRSGESNQRDRMLGKREPGPYIRRQLDGGSSTYLYSPIVSLSIEDVWEVLLSLDAPESIDVDQLVRIYREGGGECPVVRDTNDRPCASARFGCWTCTVVRRDRSAENMIEAGHSDLKPFLDFREWLLQLRNDPSMRCKRRRNGSLGLGPFTLNARKLIFEKVMALEKAVGTCIIDDDERAEIQRLWSSDASSMYYSRIEGEGYY